MSNVITSTASIIDHVRSKKNIKVAFVKKNGDDRVMNCTLDFDRIPEFHHPDDSEKEVDPMEEKDKTYLKVYDLESHGWRSIPLRGLNWLSVDDEKYEMSLDSKQNPQILR